MSAESEGKGQPEPSHYQIECVRQPKNRLFVAVQLLLWLVDSSACDVLQQQRIECEIDWNNSGAHTQKQKHIFQDHENEYVTVNERYIAMEKAFGAKWKETESEREKKIKTNKQSEENISCCDAIRIQMADRYRVPCRLETKRHDGAQCSSSWK